MYGSLHKKQIYTKALKQIIFYVLQSIFIIMYLYACKCKISFLSLVVRNVIQDHNAGGENLL